MHISEQGVQLIETFEGFSSAPYWDRYGQVWTRGFGETEGIGEDSASISRPDASKRLRELVEQRYEWALVALHVELAQNQWDALCSFAWNLGPGIFTGQLRACLQAREWQAAANIMLLYDHARGRVIEGLRVRRQLEVELFLKRPVAPAQYVPPDEARWERSYDELLHRRGPWPQMRRRVLRRVMTARRKEIWHLATPKGAPGWLELNRRARYEALLERTE